MTLRRVWLLRLTLPVLALLVMPQSASGAYFSPSYELTFQQRVEAQRAIERVYYSHQVDATLPFEEAVPEALIERKVREYLLQSAALEKFWNTPITTSMLREEAQRIARSTRMPDRLRELYVSLDNDPVLVMECLVRPALVNKLARDHFAADQRLHESARQQAMELHERLLSGDLRLDEEDPHRTILDSEASGSAMQSDPTAFQGNRQRAPAGTREIGSVLEHADAFTISVVLEEESPSRLALYTVRKISWDDWWHVAAEGLDVSRVRTVASASEALPQPRWGPEPGASSLTGGCPVNDVWNTGGAMAPQLIRSRHSAVWTGSLMVVWGASGSSGGRYDPVADAWTSTSTTDAPAARSWHTAVWTGTRMLVWGGLSITGNYENTGAEYNPQNDQWSPITTQLAPSGRRNHTAVWTGSRMVVWGGAGPSGSLGTGGSYNPQTNSWTSTAVLAAPSARSSHTAVWNGQVMIVWGGRDGGSFLNSGARYDPAADAWTPTSLTNVPTPRDSHTAVVAGSGTMIVWGGQAPGPFPQTGGRYDPVTDTWTPTTTVGAPNSRFNHTAIWTGSRMVLWGGASNGPLYARYDPAADSWSLSPYLPGGGGPDAIWTGNLMIVGGDRYDPVLDLWTPVSTTTLACCGPGSGPPVWTGQVMIRSGLRYDPIADTWAAISTVNAPPAANIALWTGSEMILWGGSSGNVGGRYDPVTNSWTAISPNGSPPASLHFYTGIWTGSRMILWGATGEFDNTISNVGAQYDPGTDTWSPVTIVNRPGPSQKYRAIWAGGRMVVWGGYNLHCHHDPHDPSPQCTFITRQYITSGGSYDPVSNTWSMFTPSLPGREEMSAISTGSEAVFWGGRACPPTDISCFAFTGTHKQDGFRYDPQTNTVTALNSVGAPEARARHAAVWTGREMIVWGGSRPLPTGGIVPLHDGGRYGIGPPPGPDTDGDGFDSSCDCDDSRASVYPRAPQICGDTLNNDCVHQTWPALSGTNEIDDDADGLSECVGDCDDTHASVRPGAPQVCDGLNNDCAAAGWPAVPANEADQDADGYRICSGDCDDGRATVKPGGAQVCDGGLNNDCTDPAWPAAAANERDQDADGFTLCTGDCDDSRASVFAGAAQVCGDGLNNDCTHAGWPSLAGTNDADDDTDGLSECAGDCDDSRASVRPGAPQICDGLNNDCGAAGWPAVPANEADQDGDGYRICSGDCDDTRASVKPGGPQNCDGVNNDCLDPPWPAVPSSEQDADGDGFPTCGGECDDTRPNVYPTAPQICGDGLNNDCVHPTWPSLTGTNEGDGDADGVSECQGDCDGSIAATHPGAPETNDGRDNQCPGESGYGLIDELTGDVVFPDAADPTRPCWPAQSGATSYRVVRGDNAGFGAGQLCADPVSATCFYDIQLPAAGAAYFYLVRANTPFQGSWGQSSAGSETTGLCSSSSLEFSFTDTPAEDAPAYALRSFFESNPAPAPSDYMMFEIVSGAGSTQAWCAQGADFYRDSYLNTAQGGATFVSGSWSKWYRSAGGGWVGPTTDGFPNSFGSACLGTYSWCAESGIGSIYLAVNPASTSSCEVIDDSAGCGGRLTIRVGTDRYSTCGF